MLPMLFSVIFGILIAVVLIAINKKISGEIFKFKLIEAEIQSYNKQYTKGGLRLNSARPDDEFGSGIGLGYLEGVTLKDTKTGERTFVKTMQFEKVLWRNIGAIDFRQEKCIFCTQKLPLGAIRVFALKFTENTSNPGFAFSDDLHKLRSIPGIIFGLMWRLFLLYITTVFILPAPRMIESALFFPVSVFIILVHSLYKFVTSISKIKSALQDELALIEQAGIPRPLG